MQRRITFAGAPETFQAAIAAHIVRADVHYLGHPGMIPKFSMYTTRAERDEVMGAPAVVELTQDGHIQITADDDRWPEISPLWDGLCTLVRQMGMGGELEPPALDDDTYWREIIVQGEESGNIRKFCEDRKISRTNYYRKRSELFGT